MFVKSQTKQILIGTINFPLIFVGTLLIFVVVENLVAFLHTVVIAGCMKTQCFGFFFFFLHHNKFVLIYCTL